MIDEICGGRFRVKPLLHFQIDGSVDEFWMSSRTSCKKRLPTAVDDHQHIADTVRSYHLVSHRYQATEHISETTQRSNTSLQTIELQTRYPKPYSMYINPNDLHVISSSFVTFPTLESSRTTEDAEVPIRPTHRRACKVSDVRNELNLTPRTILLFFSHSGTNPGNNQQNTIDNNV